MGTWEGEGISNAYQRNMRKSISEKDYVFVLDIWVCSFVGNLKQGRHLNWERDILECEVKWALKSITMNKASGGDGIPVELFQILKDDAGKVLHSICQQIWKTQQWPQVHSSTIAWRIPWTEEPGRLQSMESQRVGHDWVTSLTVSSTMPKPLTVWIITNCGKLLKRWEYQTILPVSWETCMMEGSNS